MPMLKPEIEGAILQNEEQSLTYSELVQRLSAQTTLIYTLQKQVGAKSRQLERLQSKYDHLKQQYDRLTKNASQIEQERQDLRAKLARFEQDLRALQATRTVRFTRWMGDKIRGLGVRGQGLGKDSGIPHVVAPAANSNQQLVGAGPCTCPNEGDHVGSPLHLPQPLISILTPVYNPPPAILRATVESVLNQTYVNWELCLVDGASDRPGVRETLAELAALDTRIKVSYLPENMGIALNSNAALELARGEFCALLDHDDVLTPDALDEVASALIQEAALDFLYSDNDLLSEDGTRCFQPLFKPDWSPEIMLSANYLTHLSVIRTTLLKEVGGFATGFDGAQDWDLFLRLTEKTTKIQHIPKILYHWRESAGSTATDIYRKPEAPAAQLRAIEAHLQRQGFEEGEAYFESSGFIRVWWPLNDPPPKVSIIIPTKERLDLLRPCLESLLTKTGYPNYEIGLVDTGSTAPEVWHYYETLSKESRVKILGYEQEFNYSAVNNWAARQMTGDFLLFLNNDTEIISADWLEELVRWGQLPAVGIVGAKLLKPIAQAEPVIQHAGVIVGLGGYAGHIFAGMPEGSATPFGYPEWYRPYSAVTAACMLVRREVFEKLGGFEEAFKLNGSDVDLCLRAWQAGYRVVYNPFARLYHMESATHQGHVPPEDYKLSQERYAPLLTTGDPFFNPNLSYFSAVPKGSNKP